MTVPSSESNILPERNPAEEYYNRGRDYFDRNIFPDAIRYFDKALDLDPGYLAVKYYKGVSLYNQGDRDNEKGDRDNEKYLEALKCFEEILDPRTNITDQAPYPYVLYYKGCTLGKLRRYYEAILHFEGALRAFKTSAEVSSTNVANTLRNKGYAHAMLYHRKEAYESLNEAIEKEPNFALLHNTKGYIQNMFQDYDDAIKSFTKAIEIVPKFGLCSLFWCNKGYAHCYLADELRLIPERSKEFEDNYKTAIECFDKAISIDKVRYYKEAFECFDKDISIDRVRGPSSYEWNYKGYALLFGFKKYREAVNNFDKAIELDPNFGLAWINKGFALDYEGFDLYLEGYLLESSKKYDESIKCFDNAIAAYKCRMKAQKELGDLAKNIDNLLEGKGVLLGYLKKINNPAIKSDFQRILINLAYALAGKGVSLDSLVDKEESYSEAIRCFDKVIEILEAIESLGMLEGMAANLAVVYYHKGYTLAKRQHYEPAVDYFDKAINYYNKGQDRAKLQNSSDKVHTDKANILRNEAFAYASLGKQDKKKINCIKIKPLNCIRTP